jgi:ABC-type glutathione transport system ATPase component
VACARKRLLQARLDLDTDRTRTLPSGEDDQETMTLDRTRTTTDRMLELTDIRCDFKVKDNQGRRALLHALRGVTTVVTAGESLALVGESGSGKSTLLRAIAGLETRWNGRIDKPAQHDIQMVFQDAGASLTPWMTVEETFLERLRRTKLTRPQQRRRIAETLELMSLPRAPCPPTPPNCPADNGSESPSLAPPSCRPRSCSATNRPAPSTSPSPPPSSTSSTGCVSSSA